MKWTDGAGSHALNLRDARTVGSAPGCGVVLADRAVSRIHAELAPREDGLWVRDLGSRNGTFVAGIKVNDARVPAGAKVRLGATDIVVDYDAPALAEPIWPDVTFAGLRAASATMRETFARVAELSETDEPVLFLGEAGTGKLALARALHDASPRARAPFVVVECAALPKPTEAAEILEDSLSQAEGGTLVLDDASELPLSLQRELIPPLDAKVFRVMATSQVDLRPLVNQGAFRESLYFRIAAKTVGVVPLRERLEDLPLLLAHFLGERAALATPNTLAELARLPWMGNLRELSRYAERLAAADGDFREFLEPHETQPEFDGEFGESEYSTMEAPSLDLLERAAIASQIESAQAGRQSGPSVLDPWFETGFKEFKERWIELGEREYLRRLMKRTNRSSSLASREAGLERTYLYRLLKKHGT